jgi:Rrf2 family protein
MLSAIYLSEVGGGEPVRVSEIAESVGVPRNYLSKILHQLARSGLLVSERGPRGGFALALPAEEITVQQVVDARHSDRRCLLGRAECTDAGPCPAHVHWQDLADRITSFMHETTLADLRRQPGGARRRCA